MAGNNNNNNMDDDARADALATRAYDEPEAAVERLNAAVRSGDEAALRAVMARHGFALGAGGHCVEHLVLRELMRHDEVPLTMLRVLFCELGGRFVVSGASSASSDVCVFSLLIEIDGERWCNHARALINEGLRNDDTAAACWAARMAAVVRYLVEDLALPIRMVSTRYSVPDTLRIRKKSIGRPAALIDLAREYRAWPAYLAFEACGVAAPDSGDERLRLAIERTRADAPYWVYFFAVRADLLADDDRLDLLPQHTNLTRAALRAAVSDRREPPHP